ncbi:MAG: ring-cleaving dioxygenase [Chitinophagaceae bacterium]|jgi:glyoxalase family protein|nr:ring-cleaving dioxygenase [Chitinophagaceae bacterium]
MEQKILGLHHITAIAGPAQRNLDFYTQTLGLRFIKKTVNFDDPNTYHFYYGNQQGEPGTILTFFPWERVKPGVNGPGMATNIGYAVPEGSLAFWADRFTSRRVVHGEPGEQFGEQYLPFQDPDGLQLRLIVPTTPDPRKPWTTADIQSDYATRGFHSVTLTVRSITATATILTDIFGYTLVKQEGNRFRFTTDAVAGAAVVDIIEAPGDAAGHVAGGTNHHVAFRVANDEILMHFREKILAKGLHITEKIDRNYFYSLYFREPGGVLFELASDNPGFTVDESLEELGRNLKLPAQYEPYRAQLEKTLTPLKY